MNHNYFSFWCFCLKKPDAFTTPLRAMLKTTMGMLGEFEYDTVFNGDYTPVTMSWLIYVAYLVICCIILMNLLVCSFVYEIMLIMSASTLLKWWFYKTIFSIDLLILYLLYS